jgi:hypothetical protein
MRFSNCGGVYILTVPEDEDVMRRGLEGCKSGARLCPDFRYLNIGVRSSLPPCKKNVHRPNVTTSNLPVAWKTATLSSL